MSNTIEDHQTAFEKRLALYWKLNDADNSIFGLMPRFTSVTRLAHCTDMWPVTTSCLGRLMERRWRLRTHPEERELCPVEYALLERILAARLRNLDHESLIENYIKWVRVKGS